MDTMDPNISDIYIYIYIIYIVPGVSYIPMYSIHIPEIPQHIPIKDPHLLVEFIAFTDIVTSTAVLPTDEGLNLAICT